MLPLCFLTLYDKILFFCLLLIPQALIAEVRMLDSRMNEYKRENQSLANELANVKKKYLRQKKLHR